MELELERPKPQDAGDVAASTEPAEVGWPSRRLLWALWIGCGAVLLLTLGVAPVRRTQEARVLETAREMLGADVHGWIVPQLNGEVRLKKPPLAYWLAATSFKIFGVSEWAGRLPGAVAGWLTVGVTFAAARWLFNRRAAFFAAAALFGSYFFARFAQLAETDVLAMLFCTCASYCLWRAWDAADVEKPAAWSARRFHLAGVAVGLAALAKGPPAAFPMLFFVMLCVVGRHKRGPLRRAVTSGAIVTAAAVALPWFAYLYVFRTPGSRVIFGEMDNVTRGNDHGGWFFVYVPLLLIATAPWCALLPVAIYEACRRWRTDIRPRGLLLWAASILLPLCLIGNKQPHYLMPLLPPLAIVIGWVIDLAVSRAAEEPLARVIVLCFQVMLGGIGVAVIAALVTPWVMVKHVRPADVVIAGGLAATAVVIWRLAARGGVSRGLAAYAVAACVVMPVIAGLWVPTLYTTNTRTIAAELHEKFGRGPYRFAGDSAYLPLCFAVRQEMPYRPAGTDLSREAAAEPGLVVLLQRDERAAAAAAAATAPASPLPADFELAAVIGAKDQRFEVYRRRDDGTAATSRPSARAPE